MKSKIMSFARRLRHDERGAVIVLVSLMIIGLPAASSADITPPAESIT